MHNATTKQRLSALRRKLGIYTGGARWVREPRARLAALQRTVTGALLPLATYAHRPGSSAPPPREALDRPSASGGLAAALASGPVEPTAAAGPPLFEAPRQAAATMSPERARCRLVAWLAVAAFLAGAGIVSDAVRSRHLPGRPTGAAAASGAAPEASGPDRARSAIGAERGAAPTGVRVDVRRGDCLWHLARVHLGDPMRWTELHALNRDRIEDPDVIFPGQRLRLPER